MRKSKSFNESLHKELCEILNKQGGTPNMIYDPKTDKIFNLKTGKEVKK